MGNKSVIGLKFLQWGEWIKLKTRNKTPLLKLLRNSYSILDGSTTTLANMSFDRKDRIDFCIPLLQNHVLNTLEKGEFKGRWVEIAEMVIDFFMMCGEHYFIFTSILLSFTTHSQLPAFTNALTPFILSHRLQILPSTASLTQISDNLLETKQTQLLERMILNLKLSNLDCAEVFEICFRAKAYHAMIYVSVEGLRNYLAPAAKLAAIWLN